MDFDILCVDHVDKMRTITLAFHVLFVIQVDKNPPMMTSSIDLASSTDFNVGAVVDLNEVDMSFGSISRPVPDTFGCSKSSKNLDFEILNILDLEGHGVKGFGRNFDNPFD